MHVVWNSKRKEDIEKKKNEENLEKEKKNLKIARNIFKKRVPKQQGGVRFF